MNGATPLGTLSTREDEQGLSGFPDYQKRIHNNCESAYFLEAEAAISLAISARVFPSVLMPSSFAATISGSDEDCVGVLDVDVSWEALWNSFLTSPIDRANSGSFDGPQRNMIKMTTKTMSHS